ncbi:Cysteine rich repeat-containing protein [Methylocella tundrae]|uniref:Cysteine rich repeat-containing protein n=1 Tax=Methylocella tundrae TaxID=227605 RepID=A0A8B6M7F1_METTU|nr:hypothetical protein [Methylocella tundrae]VTZ50959.1 Cysteine rich repeat-containing protein [Methylocella tundrae]
MFKAMRSAGPAQLLGAAATAVLLTLTSPGRAEPTQAQIGAIRASCQSDYRANCAGVPPGGSAALACLRKNLANLSPSCQTAVNAAGGAAAPAEAAPAPAKSEPASPPAASTTPQSAPAAPAAPPAAGAASPAPTPAAPAPATPKTAAPAKTYPPLSPREEMMVIRRACGPDYRALCAGERPGQGRIAACLRANAASLSEACRTALLGARR